jgi:hypothetical protein
MYGNPDGESHKTIVVAKENGHQVIFTFNEEPANPFRFKRIYWNGETSRVIVTTPSHFNSAGMFSSFYDKESNVYYYRESGST